MALGATRFEIRPEAAKRLRDEIGIIASHFESPLLTAPMQAEEALIEGGHLAADVVTSHPGLTRGRNEWEDRLTAISVGAEAGSIEDMELIAGAFYARDPVRIVSMAARPDDPPLTPWIKEVPTPENWPDWPWPYRATRLRRMRDGRMQVVQVDVHPDPRVQRVIEQIREALFGPLAAFWSAPMQEPQHPTEPAPAGPPAASDDVQQDSLHPFDPAVWVPPAPRQPGSGAAPPSVMVHGPPDG